MKNIYANQIKSFKVEALDEKVRVLISYNVMKANCPELNKKGKAVWTLTVKQAGNPYLHIEEKIKEPSKLAKKELMKLAKTRVNELLKEYE